MMVKFSVEREHVEAILLDDLLENLDNIPEIKASAHLTNVSCSATMLN